MAKSAFSSVHLRMELLVLTNVPNKIQDPPLPVILQSGGADDVIERPMQRTSRGTIIHDHIH